MQKHLQIHYPSKMKINCQVNASMYTYITNHTIKNVNKPSYAQLPTTQTRLLQDFIFRAQDWLELDSSLNILVEAQLMQYLTVFRYLQAPKNF